MRISRTLVLAVASIALAGCYHVTVTTGATPAATTIDKPFQHSFVYGLVPPSEMNTKAECPNGVAKVETESSFINGLVSMLTWSLYTPIHVKVTCGNR